MGASRTEMRLPRKASDGGKKRYAESWLARRGARRTRHRHRDRATLWRFALADQGSVAIRLPFCGTVVAENGNTKWYGISEGRLPMWTDLAVN